MNIKRLMAYGLAGMIVGLLVENQALIAKQYAEAKARLIKKKAEKLVHDL